eukprot:GHVR01022521.1.p1 GENE.GHVR01022521.1~~GHVR01022521.1.p1  ORF type:complete len:694 (+),score=59.45 GHVR01022521.1:61-2142(+)
MKPEEKTTSQAPIARKVLHEFEIHGTKIQDEYQWLRADGWPDKITDTKVIAHLEEENKYFENFISPHKEKKEELFEELKGRIKLADQSTYTKKDNFYYYTRTEEDKDYTIYCRKKDSIEAAEEIILDVNELAKGKEFTAIGAFSISPDHKLMAYSVDFTGGEKYTIRIYNLESKEFLKDEITDTIGRIVWHRTLDGFFYSPTNEKWRHDKIKFHKLGTSVEDNKLILHEEDPLYSVSVFEASSKQYIFINIDGHDCNEIHYIDMQDENLNAKLISKREDNIFYSVDHNAEYFYKNTNGGAKNFHILKIKSNSYSSDTTWQTYIAEKQDSYLSGFDITKNYILLNYKNKVKGLPEIIVRDLNNDSEHTLKFPDSAYTANIFGSNFEEDDIRITYSSLARPITAYQYDFNTDKLTTLKVQEIPSGLNSDEYMVERIFADTDGVQVPISLFYKKSLFKEDGSNPLFLQGYGSYGIGNPAAFTNFPISLVDRGFVYAIAHIRGGDDLGHDWYEAAKFLTKKRTFSDFIAVAEKLIASKYTTKGNIVIWGRSAGGMLIGNVINQRPELFKAAITHVPFVDVLITMLDGDLPLTPGEYKEWGNPKDLKYFEYMKSYCPYCNVSAQNYPHLFVTAGLSDPRVGYWEAAKWVAKLRDRKLDNNLLLYKTNMSFGHAGASGRFDYLKEVAEDLVFIIEIFGK